MAKPKLSFKNKPEYTKGETVKLISGEEVTITEVIDTRDYSDQFRPDFKDGLEYSIITGNGEQSTGYRWWDFQYHKK